MKKVINIFALIAFEMIFSSMSVPEKKRVLIIGDSVSMDYTPYLIENLNQQAVVSHPAANCGSTRIGLRDIDKWIGDTSWTIIHFNFGLHDLSYRFTEHSNRNERGEYATPFNGGHVNVPLKEYEENLRKLVSRLKKTKATLIFATTTPVSTDLHSYIKDSELPYNEIAWKVMQEERVMVNDLWGFAKPQLRSIQIPGNPHFTAKGSVVLAQKVAASIRAALQEQRQI